MYNCTVKSTPCNRVCHYLSISALFLPRVCKGCNATISMSFPIHTWTRGVTALFCLRECVQCRAFGTGEKKDTCERDCGYFNLIKVKDRDKLPQPVQAFPLMHCKERDANDCWFYYTYAVNNTEKEVHVVEALGEETLFVSLQQQECVFALKGSCDASVTSCSCKQ